MGERNIHICFVENLGKLPSAGQECDIRESLVELSFTDGKWMKQAHSHTA
jgi:hypothetical protein